MAGGGCVHRAAAPAVQVRGSLWEEDGKVVELFVDGRGQG